MVPRTRCGPTTTTASECSSYSRTGFHGCSRSFRTTVDVSVGDHHPSTPRDADAGRDAADVGRPLLTVAPGSDDWASAGTSAAKAVSRSGIAALRKWGSDFMFVQPARFHRGRATSRRSCVGTTFTSTA